MVWPRQARREDYPVYARLWLEMKIGPRPFELETWDREYRAHTTFLETDKGELVAYGLALPIGAHADVLDVVVDPAWRGRGLGRQMMAVLAANLRARGCREWRLVVRPNNDQAIALYKSFGLVVVKVHARQLEMAGRL